MSASAAQTRMRRMVRLLNPSVDAAVRKPNRYLKAAGLTTRTKQKPDTAKPETKDAEKAVVQ